MALRVSTLVVSLALLAAPAAAWAERSSAGAVTHGGRGEEGVARRGKADADELPDAFRKPPFSKQCLSVGAPNHGRLIRAHRLPHEPAIKLFKATSERGFGTPVLIKTLVHAAKSVRQKHPGSTLLVVELSDKNGGVAPSKRSHQSGRDGDLAFYALDKKGKSASPKHLVHFDGSGKAMDGSGIRFDDERNWALVDSLANMKDTPVTHIFVDAKLRQRLLVFAEGSGKKPERIARVSSILFVSDTAEVGDAYFHVRVRCPNGQNGLCEEGPR